MLGRSFSTSNSALHKLKSDSFTVLFLFKYCKAEAIWKQNSIFRCTLKEERFRQLSRLPPLAYSITIIGISANTVIPKGLTMYGQSSCFKKRCSVYIIPTVSTHGTSIGHLIAASFYKSDIQEFINEEKSNMHSLNKVVNSFPTGPSSARLAGFMEFRRRIIV
ncbi:hypothetical protein T4B_13042 [Trichinella pseudospiralis]|uniref:Uncharacterized protein n=1 Tax=Trichinella pseudospiralis TaxID=6337 RepID=A0A0V1HUW2_TRIPS|nr:hypothetical protein T4A_12552 [Trichinella pseudospiralis]KRY68802.1 hypothetical protein T4A_12552 [Trichinella pseudospiralis]KRZ13397.1 hypothetical protein T4B_13042 [Trichinella pseudospiralis]KRZ13398.1 hypothetical protein T4B_13042 [Trichinella pseudospiralis]KRZ25770.1 hypothetical protein T4C_14008 [Trichinella pseudospiralis]